jgi:hypothetical protein
MGRGLMRHNGFLLEEDRYAHRNLPTMRGVNMMMVVLRVLVVHPEWQYTFTNGI